MNRKSQTCKSPPTHRADQEAKSPPWAFSEGRNSLNAASHCDIAWAGALATHAHLEKPYSTGPLVA
jgi:hypothetical protein